MESRWVLTIIFMLTLSLHESLAGNYGPSPNGRSSETTFATAGIAWRKPTSPALTPSPISPLEDNSIYVARSQFGAKEATPVTTGTRDEEHKRTFSYRKPIPVKLILKETLTSPRDVDEATYRRFERDNKFRDASGLPESRRSSGRSISASPNHRTMKASYFSSSHKSLGGKRPKENVPITASIRGYIATPGKSAQRISGTPMQLLEKTYFKGKALDLGPSSLSAVPTASMTVIPGVVQSFPIHTHQRNFDLNSNSIHESGSSSSKEDSSMLHRSGSFRSDGSTNDVFKRFTSSALRPDSRVGRMLRFDPVVRPKNLRIFVFSQTPSENQPSAFWQKILQLAPFDGNSNGLALPLSNAIPRGTRKDANLFSQRTQKSLQAKKHFQTQSARGHLPPTQKGPRSRPGSKQTFTPSLPDITGHGSVARSTITPSFDAAKTSRNANGSRESSRIVGSADFKSRHSNNSRNNNRNRIVDNFNSASSSYVSYENPPDRR